MIYQVIGHNKLDYITDTVGWELLKIFSNKQEAEEYVKEMKDKNYQCKIESSEISPFSKDIDNFHWEIFTGI